MDFISKQIILSKRGKFILFLVGIYIVVSAIALPYGFFPSLAISTMAPLSVLLIAYPTHYILLPRFARNYTKKANNHFFFPLSLLLMAAVMAFVWTCLYLLFQAFDLPKDSMPHDGLLEKYFQMRFLNPSLFFLTYLFTCIFYVHNQHHEGLNKMMNEKKELEMKILKSQINSHFLHNALNNIYSMIYFGNKDDASKYVMKLSQMLRYVLDDCEADFVPISGEIKYIENYIDFQKSRFETDKDIRFNYIQHTTDVVYIPPMIFQPLIENCFKYCPLEKEGSYVNIELETRNGQIRFVCENTQNEIKQLPEKKGTGIGLENLEKRLQIYYKGNYSLNISDKQDFFKVELIINS